MFGDVALTRLTADHGHRDYPAVPPVRTERHAFQTQEGTSRRCEDTTPWRSDVRNREETADKDHSGNTGRPGSCASRAVTYHWAAPVVAFSFSQGPSAPA